MTADNIDTLTASHEKRLAKEMEAAFLALLAIIDADQLAAALDDTGADHIRAQLAIILELDDAGTPRALADALEPTGAALASFVAAVAALAAAQARHTLNTNGAAVAEARAQGKAFVQRYHADTAAAIVAAIESAIYGPGTAQARAAQLKRSIGLTIRQTASLDVMAAALRRFIDTPRTLTPARTDFNGVRIPASYVRQANTRAIIAATRGRISAAQKQILARALANPKLTQADADALLDAHAVAMRSFRIRAVAADGVHQLAETAKLVGWRIAQRFGALPADQRRYWRRTSPPLAFPGAGDESRRCPARSAIHNAVRRQDERAPGMGMPVQINLGGGALIAMLPHGLKAFDESASHTSPERRLMLAAVVNAVADAIGNGAITRPGERDQARREALAWFRAASPDYEAVCHLAGLDPENTRRAVLAFVASGQPLPAVRRANRRRSRTFPKLKEAA